MQKSYSLGILISAPPAEWHSREGKEKWLEDYEMSCEREFARTYRTVKQLAAHLLAVQIAF
jgi:hypothetical protein